ncbi:ABC transporter permease [Succinimonas sp.]|jgi:capsular polysaccharide transport system permease protein|uniref:ABC transporter permease n=1 Tax=Succinimonas sp. TaxID=1936151 RepID=UPI00386B1E9F
MFTVIKALFLRETYTLYGTDKLAYFWALLRDVFGVGIMIAIRLVSGLQFEKGLHIVYFCLCGFFIFYVVTESVSKCMSAIQANSAILSFPHVIPLDIMISRCLFVFFTNVQSAIAVIILAVLYGIEFEITDALLFIYCIITAVLLGFSAGLFMSAMAVFYPILDKIWPIIVRIGFFLSGVFFTLDSFPSYIAEPMKLNPILQLIEGLRKALSHSVDLSNILSFSYVYSYILVFLTLGLFFQNAARERLDD